MAYVAGFLAGWAAISRLPDSAPFERVVVADVVATVVCFAFSFVVDNTSVYDPYWSVAPMIIAPYLALGYGDAALRARQTASDLIWEHV
ncbi:hypothetical protein T484DRAFT_1760027 [Baffinella frigidus]|nr:hypothetical protein T484DRAFT_1760027 [Cryptophyta sp. CCMP2293]